MNLQDIYDSLPSMECKGLCFESCGPIEIFPKERENLGDDFKHKSLPDMLRHLHANHSDDNDGCITCPMLKDNKCSVYHKRPIICRLWGLVESMKCEHGCKPTRYLTVKEGHKYLDMVRNLK